MICWFDSTLSMKRQRPVCEKAISKIQDKKSKWLMWKNRTFVTVMLQE